MPSFSYTVNGELNSFRTPVRDGVARLARLTLRITLACRFRPRQRFRTSSSDAIHAAHREPADAGTLIGGHEFPMEPVKGIRCHSWWRTRVITDSLTILVDKKVINVWKGKPLR